MKRTGEGERGRKIEPNEEKSNIVKETRLKNFVSNSFRAKKRIKMKGSRESEWEREREDRN